MLTKKSITAVAVIKGKLMPIDNTLPILLEFKTVKEFSSLELIIFDDIFWSMQSEKFFNSVINQENIIIWAPNTSRYKIVRLFGKIRLFLRLIALTLFGRIWFFNFGSLGLTAKILIKLNRLLHKGHSFLTELTPVDPLTKKHTKNFLEKRYQRKSSKKSITRIYDTVLISNKEQRYDFTANEDITFIECGYARGFSFWQSKLASSAKKLSLKDNFMFWPLTVLNRDEPDGSVMDLEENMYKTLRCIKKYHPTLKIVFRYHPTTDRNKFSRILKRTDFKNYEFSNDHPIQILQRCSFVFSNTGTSIFADAVANDVPIVQYSPDKVSFLLKSSNGKFKPLYAPLIDYFTTNEIEFRGILKLHMTGKLRCKKKPKGVNEFVSKPVSTILKQIS